MSIAVTANDTARNTIRAIASLLSNIDAQMVTPGGGGSISGQVWRQANIPAVSYEGTGDYFLLHHTNADTVDKIAPVDVSRGGGHRRRHLCRRGHAAATRVSVQNRTPCSTRLTLICPSAAGLVWLAGCNTSAQQPKPVAPSEVVARIGSSTLTMSEVGRQGVAGVSQLVWRRQASFRPSTWLVERRSRKWWPTACSTMKGARHRSRDPRGARDCIEGTQSDRRGHFSVHKANPQRVNGATLDQVRTPIRLLLIQERMDAARTAFVDTLKEKTTIAITLEPPRVEVTDGGRPVRGSSNATVEVIEFSDFQCPFCQRANPVVEQVLKTYGNKIVRLPAPSPPNHPERAPGGRSGGVCGSAGQVLGVSRPAVCQRLETERRRPLAHATAVGLDSAKVQSVLRQSPAKPGIDADIAAADKVGVTARPRSSSTDAPSRARNRSTRSSG